MYQPYGGPPPPISIPEAGPSTSYSASTSAHARQATYHHSKSTHGIHIRHKNAHHLHSIPPREKSVRTLIIDHMLWVHARTRFSQARAELGMTDRTGGPSSPHHAHRERPENFAEDEQVESDGEDIHILYARTGGPTDSEEERLRKQDLPLARSLRLRAEGLERVSTSMLEQPPEILPHHDDDFHTPPTSPKLSKARDPEHPHTLPNGVRLRLALGTVINDLFARQAPPPPARHLHHPSTGLTPTSASTPPVPSEFSHLPAALTALAGVSASPRVDARPSSFMVPLSPIHSHLSVPNGRTRMMYNDGANPDTANAPPSLRCPRHLHTGCHICVEAKTRPSRLNASQASPTRPYGGGITGWQEGAGIGSGLATPGTEGSALRRKEPPDAGGTLVPGLGTGNTRLSELIPRFLRLSALVATELGRELKEGGSQTDDDDEEEEEQGTHQGSEMSSVASPTAFRPRIPSPATTRAIYAYALRPSREWYMLLAGLLTRAVLEGYLTAGWAGLEPVQCLLAVGLGMIPTISSEEHHGEFDWFEPDELPTLHDAVKILFPALRGARKDKAETEYHTEMSTRLRQFYDIPGSTPDVVTHMEDLAWKYPAEPVERAAVRFSEAIAKWRGRPELETYKKKPDSSAANVDRNVLNGQRRQPIDKYFTLPPAFADDGDAWRFKRPRSPEEVRSGKRPHVG